MMTYKKHWIITLVLIVGMLMGSLAGCGSAPTKEKAAAWETTTVQAGTITQATTQTEEATTRETTSQEAVIQKDGTYTSAEEVALYLHTYNHLPSNFITKKQAEKLGWNSKAGNLHDVAPGKSIGGSHYGNYEEALPKKDGRKYYECDIEYEGGHRGAKRLIYSDDGLIFYTEDHYKTFTQLY